MDSWQVREWSSLHPVKSFYLWICVTWAKSSRKQVLQSAVSGERIKERHYVQHISWINQPSGYSLWFLLAQVCTGNAGCEVACTSTHRSSWIRQGSRTDWCDRGVWMGERKSGSWHLALRTVLWPRLVECWTDHINNKLTAKPLWQADDVLYSHHPSQTRDLRREWKYKLYCNTTWALFPA